MPFLFTKIDLSIKANNVNTEIKSAILKERNPLYRIVIFP